MSRLRTVVAFSVLFSFSWGPAGAAREARAEEETRPLVFKAAGAQKASHTLVELKGLIPPRAIRVMEPHERKEVTYTAIPARELFDKIYGKDWRRTEEVVFTCADGYQPSIPVAYFLGSNAFFAFERVGKDHFVLNNKDQNETLVGLGPFYLVWDNIQDRSISARGSSVWPYQVVGVDLVRFKDRYPGMSPASDAPAKVREGFLAFRTHCMSCHTINGEGGKKARDLNYPVNVTEQRKDGWLYKFIENPSKFSPGIQMAGFTRSEPQWRRQIRSIVAYLGHMKGRKSKPAQ